METQIAIISGKSAWIRTKSGFVADYERDRDLDYNEFVQFVKSKCHNVILDHASANVSPCFAWNGQRVSKEAFLNRSQMTEQQLRLSPTGPRLRRGEEFTDWSQMEYKILFVYKNEDGKIASDDITTNRYKTVAEWRSLEKLDREIRASNWRKWCSWKESNRIDMAQPPTEPIETPPLQPPASAAFFSPCRAHQELSVLLTHWSR